MNYEIIVHKKDGETEVRWYPYGKDSGRSFGLKSTLPEEFAIQAVKNTAAAFFQALADGAITKREFLKSNKSSFDFENKRFKEYWDISINNRKQAENLSRFVIKHVNLGRLVRTFD